MSQNMEMRIWEGQQIIADFPDAQNLFDLIAEASKRARINGDYICSINVNELDIDEAQESRFAQTPIGEIKSFKIQTQGLKTLLDQSIAQCLIFLCHLLETLEATAILFRNEDLRLAQQTYQKCLEGTSLVVEMLSHYKIAYLNSKFEDDDLSDWLPMEESLVRTLKQILEEFSEKNYILVADLLEYDLISILTKWKGRLEKIGTQKSEDPGR